MSNTTVETTSAPAIAPRRGSRSESLTAWARELSLAPAIILAIIVGSFVSPQFLTANNLINNVMVASSVLGLLVIAESIILISGYFDLSLESIVGIAPMVAVWVVVPQATGGLGWELNPYLAILIMFVLSAVIGTITGFLVARLKLNAFMVTLAMLILLRGITVGISGGKSLSGLPPEFLFLGSARPLGVPVQVWILVVVVVLAAVFMGLHPVGRKLYAMGGSSAAAAAAGIKTTRLTMGIFIFGAVLASFAGLMQTGRIASATASQGDGMIFTVFAAAVIGGISLNGGRGSMIGAALGVLLLGIIQNILILAQVPAYWIEAIYGLIILIALVFNHFATRRARRGRELLA